MIRGRFAPSPTGRMHAGNIYAALWAWLIAKSQEGEIVLRIEDLDHERSRQEYIDQIQRDFEAFGLGWDKGPYFQQNREAAYREAFHRIEQQVEVYPCYCSRADLRAASAPHPGEHSVYSGHCYGLSQADRDGLVQEGRRPSWRLHVPEETIAFEDGIQGYTELDLRRDCGDFVLRRSDGAYAYQLAVVVDDGAQEITSVVRGSDLLSSTPQQIYLQRLLGLPEPEYHHVPLLVAADGRRLSKRDHDASFEKLLGRYKTPAGILGHIAYLAGLQSEDEPCSSEELLKEFDLNRGLARISGVQAIIWHP